jgi:Flp pilus assembly protein TadG
MKLKEEKGAAAVEFAIVLPLMCMLLFGIIEFGLVMYDQTMITNASREGARAGIVFNTTPVSDGEITTVVENYCSAHLVSFGSGALPTTTISRTGTAAGDALTVNVTYPYTFLVLPNFATSLTGAISLQAETVMRME